MHLESPKVRLTKSRSEVFDLLNNLENFRQLMPENIQTFEVLDTDTFKFALKGMPEIVLRRKDLLAPERIVLGAASDKLPFTLAANLTELNPNETEVGLFFDGEFNAMMAMMIKTPLSNFLEALAGNLSKL
jgi:carbon monoxide dehydrogenase subunit G